VRVMVKHRKWFGEAGGREQGDHLQLRLISEKVVGGTRVTRGVSRRISVGKGSSLPLLNNFGDIATASECTASETGTSTARSVNKELTKEQVVTIYLLRIIISIFGCVKFGFRDLTVFWVSQG